MCEIEEDLLGHKAMEHERKHELDRDSADHGEAEEEGLIPKLKKIVTKPTPEEVERHMVKHIPFREWCQNCVAGKSKTDPHLKGGKDEKAIPKISLDYMYMTTGNRRSRWGCRYWWAERRSPGGTWQQ